MHESAKDSHKIIKNSNTLIPTLFKMFLGTIYKFSVNRIYKLSFVLQEHGNNYLKDFCGNCIFDNFRAILR